MIALPTPEADTVYWDRALPGFGVKVTPKGRKVFIVLYRTGGTGSKLRKYPSLPMGGSWRALTGSASLHDPSVPATMSPDVSDIPFPWVADTCA